METLGMPGPGVQQPATLQLSEADSEIETEMGR